MKRITYRMADRACSSCDRDRLSFLEYVQASIGQAHPGYRFKPGRSTRRVSQVEVEHEVGSAFPPELTPDRLLAWIEGDLWQEWRGGRRASDVRTEAFDHIFRRVAIAKGLTCPHCAKPIAVRVVVRPGSDKKPEGGR